MGYGYGYFNNFKILKQMKIKMYCIYLQYGKDKPFLFEFNHSRKLCQEFYEEHQLNKPAYKIIKVEVNLLKNK